MKLYIGGRTVGRYGGSIKSLPYFDKYIENTLLSSGFTSSFMGMWIDLAYPPTYILKGVLNMQKPYEEWYHTFNFPYSRLNRRYKKIDILLQAPEFSESFESIGKDDDFLRLEIEDKYKNIPRTEIAKILIDKLILAGEIVKNKLKKEDDFDFEKFRYILFGIKNEITDAFLDAIAIKGKEKYRGDKLRKALKEREERSRVNRPKEKVIRDIRIFHTESFVPLKGLYPIEYQYIEIFLRTLQKYGFLCPVYDHLYIQVAPMIEEALIEILPHTEDWFIFGVTTFDYQTYLRSDDKTKEEMIFNMIYRGLLDIVKIDKLDIGIFEKAVNEIKEKGLDTEITFSRVENERYRLVVTYFVKSMEEQCPIYFTLTDKKNNLTSRKEIGRAEKSQIYHWLRKITLTKNSIKVQSGDTSRANAWLDNKPRFLEFEYTDFGFSEPSR